MSTKPSIEFIFDVGSPNAYLAHLVMPQLADRLGTSIDYSPVLLGGVMKATNNVSPIISLQGIKNKGEYTQLETRRFIEQNGLEEKYTWNPHFPINGLLLMRVVMSSKILFSDTYARVIDCLFDAMWLEPKKMDDANIIFDVLNQSDLPASDLLEGATKDQVKQSLIDATASAVDRGVFGAPSFFVGGELYFGKDRIREVEEEYQRQNP